MNRGLYILVGAQFLSAFADNAALFTVVAIALQAGGRGAWYVPALQSVFLVAFVTLTPWVGSLADRLPKRRLLILANLVKAAGGFAILLGVEPLIGYGVIGIGAAAYSPAKYGILPELTGADRLVKANSWVEGATIAAILFGTVGGARVADASIAAALTAIIALYLFSAAAAGFLPRLAGRGAAGGSALPRLVGSMRGLLGSQRARLTLLALSLFWASATTLRVLLVAWAPEVLHTRTASDIAELTLYLAIGIIIGSVVVPRLIPLDRVRRARFAAYAMSGLLLLLAAVDEVWPARAVLLAIGIAAGVFVVPMNAAIQQIGHGTVGSGSAVAVQNFFQNGAMLLSLGLYTAAAAGGAGSVATLIVLGALMAVTTVLVSRRLPRPAAG